MISFCSCLAEALFPSLRNIEGFDVDKSSRSFSAENGILYDGSRYSLIFYPSTKKDRVFQSPKKLGRVARTAFCCKVHFSEFVYSSKLEEFQVLPSECPELESFVPSDDAADYDGVLIKGKKLLFYPPKAGGKAYSIPDGIEEIAICTLKAAGDEPHRSVFRVIAVVGDIPEAYDEGKIILLKEAVECALVVIDATLIHMHIRDHGEDEPAAIPPFTAEGTDQDFMLVRSCHYDSRLRQVDRLEERIPGYA